ncbi:MAG: hypothetical protein WD470_10370, partial [Rhodospirillaceae bacterium]
MNIEASDHGSVLHNRNQHMADDGPVGGGMQNRHGFAGPDSLHVSRDAGMMVSGFGRFEQQGSVGADQPDIAHAGHLEDLGEAAFFVG